MTMAWGWAGLGSSCLEFPVGHDGVIDAGVAPTDRARLRYDVIANELQVSLSGAPYAALAGVGGSGWIDDGIVVRQTTITDQVAIGTLVPTADRHLDVHAIPIGSGAAIRAETTGQGLAPGSIQGACVYEAVRVRTGPSQDAWYACYAATPAGYPGDVGAEVAYHARPLAATIPGGAIAFQLEADPSGAQYDEALQAWEQPLRVRSERLSPGAGYNVEIYSSQAVGTGQNGGDIYLQLGKAGGGTGVCGRCILEPHSGAAGVVFAVRVANSGPNVLEIAGGGGVPKIGLFGVAATARETVTGSKGDNTALADLITKLTNKGLILDGTS
jgi:hypothetical protein